MSNEVLCPKCGSKQITATDKGKNKIVITCLSCGHTFKPGEGAKSEEDFKKKKPEVSASQTGKGCLVLLIIVVILSVWYHYSVVVPDNETSEKQTSTVGQTENQNPQEEDFIKRKSELFHNSLLNPSSPAQTDEFKANTKKMTKDFLKENNNTLKDWVGTVAVREQSDENGIIDGEDIMKKNIVILDIEASHVKYDDEAGEYTLELIQGQSKKSGLKGIYPSNPIYNTVITLQEGQKVKFTAKVIKSSDFGSYEKANSNRNYTTQITHFDVQFIAVERIN